MRADKFVHVYYNKGFYCFFKNAHSSGIESNAIW